MDATVPSPFSPSASDVRGLNRALSWSFALHAVAVLALILVPREWLITKKEQPNLMTISLGGSVGPRTTGTTSAGGRTVEQVAPPTKRPEPARPVPKDDAPVIPVKPRPAAPAPKPAETPKPEVPVARTPVTGPVVTQGNTVADTGARGQGAGLTLGGGGAGGDVDLKNFCCPLYLDHLTSTIGANWKRTQPEKGLTVLKFTVRKDGVISDVLVETSSGSGVLDRAAKAALLDSRLLPLPPEYPRDTLTVHLKFPYGLQ